MDETPDDLAMRARMAEQDATELREALIEAVFRGATRPSNKTLIAFAVERIEHSRRIAPDNPDGLPLPPGTSIPPLAAAPASDRGLAAWLDEQIAEADGAGAGRGAGYWAGAVTGRREALREVRERLADGGETETEAEDVHAQHGRTRDLIAAALGHLTGPGIEFVPEVLADEVRALAATPPGPGAAAGGAPEVWYSASLAHEEGFGTLPRNGLLMRDDRAYLPHHAYLAHEGTGWRRRSELPDDAIRLTPDTAVRAVLADRGYTGPEGEPVAELLRRVLDGLGARSLDPYGTGGSYPGGGER